MAEGERASFIQARRIGRELNDTLADTDETIGLGAVTGRPAPINRDCAFLCCGCVLHASA